MRENLPQSRNSRLIGRLSQLKTLHTVAHALWTNDVSDEWPIFIACMDRGHVD